MAVIGTKTVREIVTAALRKAGWLGIADTADAENADYAMSEMNYMLKGWQTMGYNLWTKTSGSLTLTTATSYTLSPVRPLKILSARYKNTDGTETGMLELMRDEYDNLPDKTTTGTPTQFYYDKQREAAVLYVWPALSSATTESIEYTYERELEDIAAMGDTVDVPGEWWDAVIYGLAVRLSESTPTIPVAPSLQQTAMQLLHRAQAGDQEVSVYFAGPWGR